MSRNKLYLFLSSACLAGYFWIGILLLSGDSSQSAPQMCIIKHLTNIPCPSCGSSRSVLSLLEGNILDSLLLNPFGLIISMAMLILPLWIVYDLIAKKSTLLIYYNKTEKALRGRSAAIAGIVIIVSNWIWNICKGV